MILGLATVCIAGVSLNAMYRFLLMPRQARSEVPGFFRHFVLPVFVAAFLFSLLFAGFRSPRGAIPLIDDLDVFRPGFWSGRPVLSALTFGLVVGFLRLGRFLWSWHRSTLRQSDGDNRRHEFGWRALSSFLTALTSAICLYATFSWLRTLLGGYPELLAPTMATFGPPMVILAFLFSTATESGLLGTLEEEETREWRASLGADFLRLALIWAVIFGISLFGPLLIGAAGPLVSAALGAGWLGTSISGVLLGGSAKTRGGREGIWEYLVLFTPSIFVVGLLVLVAILTCLLLGVEPPLSLEHLGGRFYWEDMANVSFPSTLLAFDPLLVVRVPPLLAAERQPLLAPCVLRQSAGPLLPRGVAARGTRPPGGRTTHRATARPRLATPTRSPASIPTTTSR